MTVAGDSALSLTLPLTSSQRRELRAGQLVELSGLVYTARDAAHQRLVAALDEEGQPVPFDLSDAVIYYCGPAPAPPGRPIGSCGPTTSSRMDPYLPRLLAEGLAGSIGKGNRSPEVRRALVRYGAVYFIAVGGAGALAAQCVEEAHLVAYEELGPEAVYALRLRGLPVLVAYDCHGGTVFAGEEPLAPEEIAAAREGP
ncbi:MAG: fumarate hydratase C-terminal domain-containing protein [Armatimonadetes bacterium]|nr:fumarate hydratase C-terminal domain-containing protein [Armatimonadota bacterium]